MPTNWKQLKAIEAKNKKRILEVCPTINDASGIYIMTRYEDGFKYAYIGQAKRLLTRLAQHLSGYQHIDLSIKRHGLWSDENCYKSDDISCGSSICVEENKQLWKNKIDKLIKELYGEGDNES